MGTKPARNYEVKPNAPLVISLIQGCVTGAELASLASMSVKQGAIFLPHLALVHIGLTLSLLGLPLFWMVNGAGWVLLVLSHGALILQGVSNALLARESVGHDMILNLAGIALHVAFLRVLTLPSVFELYAQPQVRLWKRARRIRTHVPGRFFHVDKRSEGVVLDVSSTGCLLMTGQNIALGELLTFHPTQDPDLEIQMQVLRKVKPEDLGLGSGGGTCFGARFTHRLNARAFRRFLSAQTRASSPGVPTSGWVEGF